MKSAVAALLLPVAALAAAPAGVSWGVPWPKGEGQPNTPMRLTAADGHWVEAPSWPLAHWPDGSVKWSSHAITATQQPPLHTCAKGGQYIVVLNVDHPDGSSRRSKIWDVALR